MNKIGLFDTNGSVTTVAMEADAAGGAKSIIDFFPRANLSTRTEMSLQSSAETSRKGVVRILLKVNLPYSGLYPSDVATGESNLKFSPNRSVGMVSAHLVLTLPKECVQDIVQQKAGSTGRDCAISHIATVLGILETLLPRGNGKSFAVIYGDGAGLAATASAGFPVTVSTSGAVPAVYGHIEGSEALTTLIDRACRGYTPLADVDEVGIQPLP